MNLIENPLSALLTVIAVAWVVVGIITLTNGIAFVVWLVMGLAVLAAVYFSSVRMIKRGRGDSEW